MVVALSIIHKAQTSCCVVVDVFACEIIPAQTFLGVIFIKKMSISGTAMLFFSDCESSAVLSSIKQSA
jgi:hypothetical protein